MSNIDTHGHDDESAAASEPLYDAAKPAASQEVPQGGPYEMVRAQTPEEVEAQRVNRAPSDAQVAEGEIGVGDAGDVNADGAEDEDGRD